jgi:putative endonuclease
MYNPYRDGQIAENIALNYLQQQGLLLIQKNFHSRFGEIDLIMHDKFTTVFVEVRKRNTGIDNAIESITPTKQRKLVKAAEYYMLKNRIEIACRFDLIAMDSKHQILWLKNIITG